MVYEVTATRRRPQTFEDLVGQEFVVATLKNAIKTGKIAHAYLFSGPRGCGKTSSARILARALNCEHGPTDIPCGQCNACNEIARGSSLDVIEIDGASNTSVNDVRQIKDEVLFPPNSSRYKIYIIDEVHMLSTSAFNALLKTIEEPPPYVIFIFATTELHKVPATIKSRCQQFNFRLVAPEIVKNLLADAAAEMNIKADDEALYWIAKESTGSVRDAYTLFDQVSSFSDNHITFEKIRDKLGLAGVDKLNELCELCIDNKNGEALEKLDLILQAGTSIDQFIINFADYLRSLLLIQSGVTKEALLGQSASRFSTKVIAQWDSIKLERALSMFLQLFRDIRYSLSPRVELELAISRLAHISGYVSPFEVKKAIDSARNLLLSGVQTNTFDTYQKQQGGVNPLSLSGFSNENSETAFLSNSTSPFDQIRKNITETRTQSYQQPVQSTLSQHSTGSTELIKNNDFQSQTQAQDFSQKHAQNNAQETNDLVADSASFLKQQQDTKYSTEINMQAASFVFDNAGDSPIEKPNNFSMQTQREQYSKLNASHSFQDSSDVANNTEEVNIPHESTEPLINSSQNVQQENASLQESSFVNSEPFFSTEFEEDDEDYEEYEYQDYPKKDSALQSFDPKANKRYAVAENSMNSTDSLIGEVVERISSEKTLTGTALLNAIRWSFVDNKVICFIEKPFLKNQIETETNYISSVFSEISGKSLVFEVQLEKQPESAQTRQEEIPKEVELLCQVFKGTQIPQ
ncbi:MAG: DNA polymerase III subunit gamma/tau [Treponema sp.]|jgi:DNA polymerase-3 subunit gamma/tau|nr:DNA polymerase III subunit gamma/tau [Treponema sp.]